MKELVEYIDWRKELVRKIPILFVLQNMLVFGGTEKYLFEVTKRLNREKYVPFVVCFSLRDKMKEVFEEINVKVTEFPIKRIYGYDALKYGIKLFNLIKKENIKIIQTFHLLPDLYVPIVAKIAGVPIIISSRRDLGCDKKKYHLFMQRRVNVLVDKIMVNSNAVMNALIENEKVSSSKIKKIYSGVEIKNIKNGNNKRALRKKLNIKQSDFIVGFLANQRPIKGGTYFIDACPKILEQVPNTKFLIVGGGISLEELKEKVKSLGISEHTIFTGPVLNGTDYLSIMDISVNSSLSEGFSNTILESMASGISVVATSVGGNPEAVVHGKTGYLVPPGDPLAISNNIIAILKDRALAKRLGTNSRKHVEECFTMKRMISEIEEFYDSQIFGNKRLR